MNIIIIITNVIIMIQWYITIILTFIYFNPMVNTPKTQIDAEQAAPLGFGPQMLRPGPENCCWATSMMGEANQPVGFRSPEGLHRLESPGTKYSELFLEVTWIDQIPVGGIPKYDIKIYTKDTKLYQIK